MHPMPRSKYLKDFVSMFFLTLSNPLTIIAFGAIFAGLGFVSGYSNLRPTAMLVMGVFFGTIIWWSILGTFVNIFRNRIRLRNLFWINKVTGFMIVVLGVLAGLSIMFIK
jgi:threonine/homoserine/homoserine lactone efflux protein